MENQYKERLNDIIARYHMQSKYKSDSTNIPALISEMFQQKCVNKRVALWGAGGKNTINSHAAVIINQYGACLPGLVCLIDSDERLWGEDMLGFPIIAPEQGKDMEIDLIILAVDQKHADSVKESIARHLPECEILDIYEELENLGVFGLKGEKRRFYSGGLFDKQLYYIRKDYEDAGTEAEKENRLRDLIAAYLEIKDFYYAFDYIREYIEFGYDKDNQMKQMELELQELLREIKEKNRERRDDITVYFADSVRAMDVIGGTEEKPEFRLIKSYFENSLSFTNVYATAFCTYESLPAILAEQYSFERQVYPAGYLFGINESPVLEKACEKGMDIRLYVNDDYRVFKEDERLSFDCHYYMTEKLWDLACSKALDEKPVFGLVYLMELHPPFIGGYQRYEPVVNIFSDVGIIDMESYIEEQFADVFAYFEKEFMFYEDILHDKGYSVFFSDHANVRYDSEHKWPFYKYYNNLDRSVHGILAFQGPGIESGVEKGYFSMMHFSDAFCKYVYGEDIALKPDDIIRYQYYDVHDRLLRQLAQKQGWMDYVNGMDCFASEKYVYMVSASGKEEVYDRTNLEENIVDSPEGQNFIRQVRERFVTHFPASCYAALSQ